MTGSHFSDFLRTLRHQSPMMKTAITIVVLASCFFVFSMGVGVASLQESIIVAVNGRQATPIVIEPSGGSPMKGPTTLKVEIVRNGNTLCQGERAPDVGSEKFDRTYSIERPIADCPPLRVGDTVRATWIQSSEVNISFKEP
jgi:hypothetical protein